MQYYTRKYTAIWNTIPLEIRKIQVLANFKKELTEHLLELQANEEIVQAQQGHHLA